MNKKNDYEKTNRVKNYFIKTVLPAMVLVAAVFFAVVPFSCRTSIEGVEFLSGDFSVPQITDVVLVDSNTISIGFSKRVAVDDVQIMDRNGECLDGVTSVTDEENCRVDFSMDSKMDIGQKYVLEATLEDVKGNSVTMSVDFLGYNDRVPLLALSEIRVKNKSSSDKSEFVELYALSAGNLSGLEIVSASDGENKKYSFPPIEISTGEYIVVHMRNGTEGCVDELGKNLALASTTDSNSQARDLFANNESDGRFGTNGDIIALRNSANGKIMDAFVYADPEKIESWNQQMGEFAANVESSGVWLDLDGNASCQVEDAFSTSSLNRDSHTACRKDVEKLKAENFCSSKAQWYEVSATKSQTPGTRN